MEVYKSRKTALTLFTVDTIYVQTIDEHVVFILVEKVIKKFKTANNCFSSLVVSTKLYGERLCKSS